MKGKLLWILAAVVIVILFLRSGFAVSPTEYVIVTQFGKPLRTITESGLHWKLPYQSRISFDNRVQVYDPQAFELYTLSKEEARPGGNVSVGENIDVDVFVAWRIGDPLKYLQRVLAFGKPEFYLYDVVRSELSAIVAKFRLSDLLTTEGASKIPEISKEATARCKEKAEERYGMEILDVRVKRLDFPSQNRPSVFERMRAEREREAARYRAQGEGEAQAIKAEADRQAQEILAEARKNAEVIKGEADATAIEIYGNAYSKAPEFYKFTRTLDAYRKFLDDKTTLVLSGDSDLLRPLLEPDMTGSGGSLDAEAEELAGGSSASTEESGRP
jgi:membrane protease subunit HflC